MARPQVGRMIRMRVSNWARSTEFHPAAFERPESVSELQRLVAGSTRARALGSGHSFNDLADTPGTLISLERLPAEPSITQDGVRVPGGMRYAELSRWLQDRGLAVHNLASLPHISVAGTIATGTHGSGDGNGSLATAVTGLELVTAGGDLVAVRRGDPDFDGTVVSLGALGVVTAVTLEVRPAFSVRQYVYEDLHVEDFEAIASSAYSVSLFTRWRSPVVDQVWVKSLSERPPGPFFGARPADGPRHPVPGMSPSFCTQQLGVPGPWLDRLPHFRADFTPSSGEELQSEYLLPRRHTSAALGALAALGDRIAPVLQISEVRTVAADSLWMSPCYGRDTVCLHFTWVKDAAAVREVLAPLEAALAPYDPRPHWGKVFLSAPSYPRLADFRALVRRYDPDGVFSNDFLARVLAA